MTNSKRFKPSAAKNFYPARKFFDKQVTPKGELAYILITRFIESNWTIQEVNELCESISNNHCRVCLDTYSHFQKVGFLNLHKTFAKEKGIDLESVND